MPKSRLKNAGFSLIELVVILLVMAVVAGSAIINVNSAASEKKHMDEAGKRLFLQMKFASDEALVQQRLIGLRFSVDALDKDNSDQTMVSYDWLFYEDQRWVPLSEVLSPHRLADYIKVEISADDVLLDALLEQSLNADVDESDEVNPAVVFYPNSDISDFVLTLSLVEGSITESDSQHFRIFKDQRGQLTHSGLSDFDPDS